MGWKPKSCGTKTRRRGLQSIAPAKAACGIWVQGGLPLDAHEGTCEQTSMTLSLCVRRTPACLINPALGSCGAMAVVDQHRLCGGLLETFARFSGHGRSVAARIAEPAKSEAECTTSETYKSVALGAP